MVVPTNILLLETALLRHRGFMELEFVCHELTHEMELKEDKATCGKKPMDAVRKYKNCDILLPDVITGCPRYRF